MQDVEKTGNDPDNGNDKLPVAGGGKTDKPDDGQRAIEVVNDKTPSDEPIKVLSEMETLQQLEFEDLIDDQTGNKTTANLLRAMEHYDERETSPQIAEHYTFVDDEIDKHGHF